MPIDEARGVGGGEELAGELDARGHGPPAGALLADPGDHGVAGDVRAVAGEQVGAGEGAVERVGELQVPVADRAARREVHVRPALQDGLARTGRRRSGRGGLLRAGRRAGGCGRRTSIR
jgi:hypothetical protein